MVCPTCAGYQPAISLHYNFSNQAERTDLRAWRNLAMRKHERVLERRLQQLAQEVTRAGRSHQYRRSVHVLQPLAYAFQNVPDPLRRQVQLTRMLAVLDRRLDGLLYGRIEEKRGQLAFRPQVRLHDRPAQ